MCVGVVTLKAHVCECVQECKSATVGVGVHECTRVCVFGSVCLGVRGCVCASVTLHLKKVVDVKKGAAKIHFDFFG